MVGEPMILALVVAPVRVYRDAIARAFDGHEEIRVVGVARAAAEAQQRIEELSPDVAFVDVSQPAGIAAARAVAATPTRPVALAAPDDDANVVACVQAGVRGFVGREGTLTDLVDAAHAVLRDETACSPRIVAALLRAIAATPGSPPSGAPLTPRERQIVALIDEGLSNKEIAARLCIGLSTVKNHVHNALEKLGARGRSEAAARMRMVAS
jgi:two-component system nitrate/nitrite response regulator NarL